MRPIFSALALAAALAAPVRAADFRFFDDAALHAVQFVDGNEGWAVGDEGVVWHTIDGGRHWERQPTGRPGVAPGCAFPQSVHRLGRRPRGAAQRRQRRRLARHPRRRPEMAAALASTPCPACTAFAFLTTRTAWRSATAAARIRAGCSPAPTAAAPGNPWPGRVAHPGWLPTSRTCRPAPWPAPGADWRRSRRHPRHGRRGYAGRPNLARLAPGRQAERWPSAREDWSSSVPAAAAFAGALPTCKLPTEVVACLDFHAVSCCGDHVWIAGRPGSVVLHSPDRGRSWEVCPTGQPLPLHAHSVHRRRSMAGPSASWASSWQQATAARPGRSSATAASARRSCLSTPGPDQVPFGAVALLGGEEGYLTTALRVVAPDPASARLGQVAEPQRLGMAMRQSGGLAAEMLWQFPMAQHLGRCDKQSLVASWNRLHDDRAAEAILRQLVLALRVWRPEVVVTDRNAGPGTSPLEELVDEAAARGLCSRRRSESVSRADGSARPEALGREKTVRRLPGRGQGAGGLRFDARPSRDANHGTRCRRCRGWGCSPRLRQPSAIACPSGSWPAGWPVPKSIAA